MPTCSGGAWADEKAPQDKSNAKKGDPWGAEEFGRLDPMGFYELGAIFNEVSGFGPDMRSDGFGVAPAAVVQSF